MKKTVRRSKRPAHATPTLGPRRRVTQVQPLPPRTRRDGDHHPEIPRAKTACPLEVRQAVHDDEIVGGIVYVAPPDMHLLVAGGRVELSRSKLVHYSRPSIDLLFESVAGSYGARAIGVVLTGSGIDGATGLRAIKGTGGTTVVQDPSTAAHRSMPQAAVATGCVA